MENVAAEERTKKFELRESYETPSHVLWAKMKLPASLILNTEFEKSEEDAKRVLEQLRAFGL